MVLVPALLSSQRGGRVVVPAPVQAERGGRVLVPAPARAERGGLVAAPAPAPVRAERGGRVLVLAQARAYRGGAQVVPAPARTERVVAPGSAGLEVVENPKLPNSLAVFNRSRLPFHIIPMRLNEVELSPAPLKLQAF